MSEFTGSQIALWLTKNGFAERVNN